jgi:hypothetical protein
MQEDKITHFVFPGDEKKQVELKISLAELKMINNALCTAMELSPSWHTEQLYLMMQKELNKNLK